MKTKALVALATLIWIATFPLNSYGPPDTSLPHKIHAYHEIENRAIGAPVFFHRTYRPFQGHPVHHSDYRDERYAQEPNYLFSSYVRDTDATRYGYILKLANGTAYHIRSGGDVRDGTRVHVFLERQRDNLGGFGHYLVIHGVQFQAGRIN